MQPKKEKNRLVLLNVLKRQTSPVTSGDLTAVLNNHGHDLSERTVRLYLSELADEGLARRHGRRGATISPHGLDEVRAAQAYERVGYLSAKIDQMTYRMSFDLQTRSGQVVVNTSLVNPRQLEANVEKVCEVFARGYAMGHLVTLLEPGEQIGDFTVPEDKVGFCTVCSITLNGVLLKHGIPTASRFGGLVELRDRKAVRFVEMIHYDGTSIDPLEVFIRAGMTDYHGAIRDGNGRIGASFREMPEDSSDLIEHLSQRLTTIGLGAFMIIGSPGQQVLGVPVSEGRIGSVMIGGLNPIAILEEAGHRVASFALAGLLEYNRLFNYEELPGRLRQLTSRR